MPVNVCVFFFITTGDAISVPRQQYVVDWMFLNLQYAVLIHVCTYVRVVCVCCNALLHVHTVIHSQHVIVFYFMGVKNVFVMFYGTKSIGRRHKHPEFSPNLIHK